MGITHGWPTGVRRRRLNNSDHDLLDVLQCQISDYNLPGEADSLGTYSSLSFPSLRSTHRNHPGIQGWFWWRCFCWATCGFSSKPSPNRPLEPGRQTRKNLRTTAKLEKKIAAAGAALRRNDGLFCPEAFLCLSRTLRETVRTMLLVRQDIPFPSCRTLVGHLYVPPQRNRMLPLSINS